MAELVSVQRAADYAVSGRWRVLVDGEQVGSVAPAPGRGRRWQAFSAAGPTGSRETFPTRDAAVARVLDNEERRQRARRGQPGSWWYLVEADAADEHAPVRILSRHRSQQTARDAHARAAKRELPADRVLEVRARHDVTAWQELTPDGRVTHTGPPPP